ncbi:MAG: GDP-mannose 4,6-dehydratase [Candidatus Omnitrophica bacterium]|nr:GDP-mannose 4,6-dehydratase [Candidatus Omnitrophota bacterium]MCM8777473.1 GDP-mannose 4,6-dehydratase [Candidatus Omnitrophota bacterium]
MKYLITGGCGFIGSHLAEKLLYSGEEVSVIDDLSTGSLDNIGNIISNKKFHLFIETILNSAILEELIKNSDFVFHLAAVVGVKRVMENPVDSVIINVEGTYNVLRYCAKYNKRIFLASTSEIYGKNENVPFREDADIVIGTTKKKRWSYACTKAIDEFLAFAFYEEKNLPVIVARLFNTVGPRQSDRYGMVIPRFVKQALNNLPITIFGDGTQTRCFIHVKDIVDGMINLIQKDEAYGYVFNMGSEEEITIKDLALIIKEMTGSSSDIIFLDPQNIYSKGFEDMARRVPDISKVRNLIGFSPKFTIKDIIKDCIEDVKKTSKKAT